MVHLLFENVKIKTLDLTGMPFSNEVKLESSTKSCIISFPWIEKEKFKVGGHDKLCVAIDPFNEYFQSACSIPENVLGAKLFPFSVPRTYSLAWETKKQEIIESCDLWRTGG